MEITKEGQRPSLRSLPLNTWQKPVIWSVSGSHVPLANLALNNSSYALSSWEERSQFDHFIILTLFLKLTFYLTLFLKMWIVFKHLFIFILLFPVSFWWWSVEVQNESFLQFSLDKGSLWTSDNFLSTESYRLLYEKMKETTITHDTTPLSYMTHCLCSLYSFSVL